MTEMYQSHAGPVILSTTPTVSWGRGVARAKMVVHAEVRGGSAASPPRTEATIHRQNGRKK